MTAGKPFIELLEVDSTNNYAMAQVQASLAVAGTAWFAHKQTSGKGQRGKTWFSKEKENIILSIAIDPAPLTIANQFTLASISTVIALFSSNILNCSVVLPPSRLYRDVP